MHGNEKKTLDDNLPFQPMVGFFLWICSNGGFSKESTSLNFQWTCVTCYHIGLWISNINKVGHDYLTFTCTPTIRCHLFPPFPWWQTLQKVIFLKQINDRISLTTMCKIFKSLSYSCENIWGHYGTSNCIGLFFCHI
jgi:hypothetical protein